MSLEINLASTLPHHPSPSGHHLAAALASISAFPRRVPGLGALPQLSGCGGARPARGFVTWHGGGARVTAAAVGRGHCRGGCSGHRAQSTARRVLGQGRRCRDTYVMSMDWFSRSAREGAGVKQRCPVPGARAGRDGVPQGRAYCGACRCRRCRRWSRCAAVPPSAACPCRLPPRAPCTPAATCRG